MSSPQFVCISDTRIAALIGQACERVALVAPGIGEKTAEALNAARQRMGDGRVFVVVDCDEEVFRLGFGNLDALKCVVNSGHRVRHSAGLRIGVLICDEAAWTFAPTALYVASEVHSNETPNAVLIRGDDVDRILSRIAPKELRKDILRPDKLLPLKRALERAFSDIGPSGGKLDPQILTLCFRAVESSFEAHTLDSPKIPFTLEVFLRALVATAGADATHEMRPYIEHSWEQLVRQKSGRVDGADFDVEFGTLKSDTASSTQFAHDLLSVEVEVGNTSLSNDLLVTTSGGLEAAPPIPFDVARQVRVFEPYIQYVEISLKGCHVERRTIELPKSIQGLAPNDDLSSRLHTKFDLIEKSSKISSKKMETEVNQLREMTKSLGKPWGRVLLRNARERFDTRAAEIRTKLEHHKEEVERELNAALCESRERLLNHFFALVKDSPPDELLTQITNDPPTETQIRDWLATELDASIPDPSDLMSEMRLDIQFRDVTYETLNQEGFGERLRLAFPLVNWDKPFDEFDAARERESASSDD